MLDDSASISDNQFVLEKQFANQTVNSYDISPTGIIYSIVTERIVIIDLASWMGIVRFADSAWVESNVTSSKPSLINRVNGLKHSTKGYLYIV